MQTVILTGQECVFDSGVDTANLYVTTNASGYKAVRYSQGALRGKVYARTLLKLPTNLEADHKNGNSLDCRASNLRSATRQQNSFNRAGSKNKKSGLPKGVYSVGHKYTARLRHNGTLYSLGSFWSVEEAEAAYKAKALEWQGAYASQARESHSE